MLSTRENLWIQCQPIIAAAVRRYAFSIHHRFPHIDAEDLMQEAYLVLVEAMDEYDMEREVQFAYFFLMKLAQFYSKKFRRKLEGESVKVPLDATIPVDDTDTSNAPPVSEAICPAVGPVPDVVLDFPKWRKSLSKKQRRLLDCFIADVYGSASGRVSCVRASKKLGWDLTQTYTVKRNLTKRARRLLK